MPPLQDHLEALLHVVFGNRLVGPVLVEAHEFIHMILLAVILLAGELRQLLGLVDIVGVIPVILDLKAARIQFLQLRKILFRNVV